ERAVGCAGLVALLVKRGLHVGDQRGIGVGFAEDAAPFHLGFAGGNLLHNVAILGGNDLTLDLGLALDLVDLHHAVFGGNFDRLDRGGTVDDGALGGLVGGGDLLFTDRG